MKTSRTTLPLYEKDREAIQTIREYYGVKTDADAIRIALHELERLIRSLSFVTRAATRLGIGFSEVLLDGFLRGVPMLSSFFGLEFSGSCKLAEVIGRRVEHRG